MSNETNDYSPTFLVLCFEVEYLRYIAKSYRAAAQDLQNYNGSLHPFQLLATNAIELYFKTIIACNVCEEEKDNQLTQEEIHEKIDKALMRNRHDLDKVIKQSGAMEKLNIKEVKQSFKEVTTTLDWFRNEYEISFEDGSYIYVQDSISIRYGSFAKKKNNILSSRFNGRICEFMQALNRVVEERLFDTEELFKDS